MALCMTQSGRLRPRTDGLLVSELPELYTLRNAVSCRDSFSVISRRELKINPLSCLSDHPVVRHLLELSRSILVREEEPRKALYSDGGTHE